MELRADAKHKGRMKKVLLHFFHPGARKLHNLLKRVDPTQVNSETLQVLKSIGDACRAFQTYSPGPHRFRVTFPKPKCIFNQELGLDPMWLHGKPIIQYMWSTCILASVLPVLLPGRVQAISGTTL